MQNVSKRPSLEIRYEEGRKDMTEFFWRKRSTLASDRIIFGYCDPMIWTS